LPTMPPEVPARTGQSAASQGPALPGLQGGCQWVTWTKIWRCPAVASSDCMTVTRQSGYLPHKKPDREVGITSKATVMRISSILNTYQRGYERMRMLKKLFNKQRAERPLPKAQTIPDIDIDMPVLKVHFYRVTLKSKKYPDLQDEAWDWRN
jgi:hypothetical protein